MEAGKLDRFITIEEFTEESTNELGHAVKSWQTFHQCWASFNDSAFRRNKEDFQGSQTVAVANDVWQIRYLPGIKATQRIVYEGMIYNITSVKEIGRNEGLEIITETKDRLITGD